MEVPYSAGMVGPWHVLQVGFSRHFAQLKPFYADAAAAPSELRCPILGLNLILLLINNRLDEFHCEVVPHPSSHLALDSSHALTHLPACIQLPCPMSAHRCTSV